MLISTIAKVKRNINHKLCFKKHLKLLLCWTGNIPSMYYAERLIFPGKYYNYKLRRPEKTLLEIEDEKYKKIITDIFDKQKGHLVSKKICAIMVNRGQRTTPKRINRLMKEMGLVCISRKKKPNYNHSPDKRYRKNKLSRKFNTNRPNEVWASDITNINLIISLTICVQLLICFQGKLLHIISQIIKRQSLC